MAPLVLFYYWRRWRRWPRYCRSIVENASRRRGGWVLCQYFLVGQKVMTDKEKIIHEALRQTELWLEDQQAVVTAAEQRAFQFAGYCVLTATLGAGFARDLPHPESMYMAAVGLVFSAAWAVYTGIQKRFYHRGHLWREWAGHVADGDTFIHVLVSQAKENDDRINYNLRCLEAGVTHYRLSFLLAVFSVSIFMLGQFLAS